MTNIDLIKNTYMKCQGNTMHMAREYRDVYDLLILFLRSTVISWMTRR